MGDPELLRDVLVGNALLLTPEEAATVLRIGRSCRLPRAELERYVRCLGSASETAPTPTGQFEAARSSRPRMRATQIGLSSQ
jgi:hypothetical protein